MRRTRLTSRSSRTSWGCTRWPWRTRSAIGSGRSSAGTTGTTSSRRTRCAWTCETGELVTGEIAAFITASALVTVRKDDDFPLDGLLARWDQQCRPHWRRASGRSSTACSTSWSTGTSTPSRRSTTRSSDLEDLLFDERPHDSEVQRRSFELRKSLVHLRRVVLPMREVLNTLMRRDVGTGHGRAGAVLPGRLRPRPARHRVDREPARPGRHHRGDEPDDPGQPAQRHHQEGDELGRDHRRAHGRHRLLRAEPALPGLRRRVRCRHLVRPHRGSVGGLFVAFKRKGWL